MSESTPQWSDEAVVACFRAEVRARFEAHNEAFRAREAAELAVVLHAHPERRDQPGFEVRDSLLWEAYQAAEIRSDRNTVTVVLGCRYGAGTEFVHMLDHTTVAWARPVIGAMIVDGEARVAIEILLVATWTDAMDAAWKADPQHGRRRVVVELFEDEVRNLCDFISLHADRDAGSTGKWSDMDSDPASRWLVIRDKLKLDLEHP